MRRPVVMVVLAALAAAVTPLVASAGSSGGSLPRLRTTVAGLGADSPNFALGGVPCSLIEVPVAEDATPISPGTCPGVRPGGRVVTSIGLCTYNFLFVDPNGQRYIGTAGHCILGEGPTTAQDGGEQSWGPGAGPEAMDSAGKRVGQFVYASLQQSEERDFALIRLDPGVESSPEMCHFGGPVGENKDMTSDTVILQYYGQGVAVGSTIPARSAVATGFPSPNHVYADGLALPGDSGSGVISADGRAVGVLVTTGFHGLGLYENGVDFGTMGIRRIGPLVARASEVLGFPVTLVTV